MCDVGNNNRARPSNRGIVAIVSLDRRDKLDDCVVQPIHPSHVGECALESGDVKVSGSVGHEVCMYVQGCSIGSGVSDNIDYGMSIWTHQ